MALDYRKTLLLGLGFFVITLTWALYNAYVPIFLQKYITSGVAVGFIMTLDNLAAITIQPYFGARSDTTRTRFGRRMPYLLVGIPISAVFFALIPFGYLGGFWLLMATIILFNTFMSVYRAPTVALMPDLTPPPLRSKANGVINLMGGLGGVLAFFAGAKLYDLDQKLPFLLSAGLMVVVVILLFRSIREPERKVDTDEAPSMGLSQAMILVLRQKEKSTLFLLLAILSWFVGYGAVETFFTSYGKFHLQVTESSAAFALGFFSISFLAFAIPSGIIATRFGRKRTIITGLLGMLVTFLLLGLAKELAVIRILLLIAGFFWALVNINSYPMVVEMTTENNIGVYTGLYYFYSSLAAIIGPTLFGLVKDMVGYSALFGYSMVFFTISLVCMLFVTRGEVESAR